MLEWFSHPSPLLLACKHTVGALGLSQAKGGILSGTSCWNVGNTSLSSSKDLGKPQISLNFSTTSLECSCLFDLANLGRTSREGLAAATACSSAPAQPLGKGREVDGRMELPCTNLFVPHSYFFFTFSPSQNTLKGKAAFPWIFSGRVSWRSCAAFAVHWFSDPSKASGQLSCSCCRCVVWSDIRHLLCVAATV